MSPALPEPDASEDSAADGARLADLVAECVERVDREGESAVDALCARHPELAERLRQALAPLVEFGVVGPAWPVDGATATEDPARIGAYEVRRRLGAGSFGIVYLAAQAEPIRREVAIKVLRPGAGDRTTLARFEAERQVLARIGHRAVANVFDAGALPDGRPYFVMEYVDGVPITAHCDRQRLGVEARLELFLELCDGVRQAHQKGIIHRDLKPSNVLVAEQLGRPQPKIIDFGLAKAIDAGAHLPPEVGHEAQLATEAGRVLGTPGFMSPEQALGRSADVDTRSDVFALGVLLYLLLTGEMPWAPGESSTTSSPPRPSTRVASASKPASAARCAAEPRSLASRLRGDLDWIVLKALDPDRERRYQSVLDLAADVRRHLRHEPVTAGPASAVYRLRKLFRRHRVPVLAALVVLVSLVGGLATAWRFAVQAQTNLDRFEILALDGRLRLARQAAAALHPNWPERLPDFDRWLAEHGGPLLGELPRLRAALDDLRQRSLPLTEADREADRRSNPWVAEQASQQARLDYFDALLQHPTVQGGSFGDLRRQLRTARQTTIRDLAEATRLAGERRLWRFADAGQQFLHDTMARLLRELIEFAEGPSSLVARTQATRETIARQERDAEAQRPLWERVAAEMAADPRYAGQRLLPQAQLVPLGRDPVSGLQEFLHVASASPGVAIPARRGDGQLELGEESGIVFVLLPGGEGWMGAQADDPAAPCYDPAATIAQRPAHRVTLAPFFLAKHEMTQAQWLQLTGARPSVFHDQTTALRGAAITRRHPVESVSWDDCQVGLDRHGLDLPTEAQWEYACRAGTMTIWPSGDERSSLIGFASVTGLGGDDDTARPSHHDPVGSHAANAFGLHDVVGNVAEWCRDHFSSLAYLLPAAAGDGLRPVPQMQVRVVRGGSFEDPAPEGASAARHAKPFNHRGHWLGVRAARRVQ